MITQLDIENADRNIASEIAVLTHTPSATLPALCNARVELGDGSKDLDGSGGTFTYRVTVGGVTILGGAAVNFTLAAVARGVIEIPEFTVPANTEVVIYVDSPNAADVDVDVTARLFDISAAGDLDNVGIADDAITSAVYDESTAYPLRANTLNLALDGTITGSVQTGTLTVTQFSTNLSGYDNDRLIGRTLTFTSGPLDGETVDITGYANTNGVVSCTELTEAPTNGDTFVIQ